ncbi:alginate lyase family protein [Pedobacter miscanthi]|uniref:Right handed beta helix domain-containing protein n=1 Tax=Pedobacter miscanthi TaxID=2259170 RepID=A0A366L277_9SPHI|nr:alginate lyase family protein [Pedobacter miscanthi]RBQ07890.1 hypothetical protein DRW42_09830 [Pedobacter miscanthi]
MKVYILKCWLALCGLGLVGSIGSYAQSGQKTQRKFVHPGMLQNSQDLDYMRQNIISGKQPWKNAFDTLKKNSHLDFKPEPVAHVSVGPYGANSVGGREFSKSALMAYNFALLWQITRERVYADRAIRIINAWSGVLWDFDDNNAKLNVGLSGPYFLNAAELLKYSDAGWKKEDQDAFRRMVLAVFYPTIKDFFTEANGNWDASIINTLLCIGIFTDNTEIFDSAVHRYRLGPGNSGITKYIYPSGQIQETTRDWGHVQLGIGEFAKAAQVAWTQGVDFYATASNRLALGFEYTSRFMTGDESIPVYGVLSRRALDKFSDIYESVVDHYTIEKGLDLPYTSRLIREHTRNSSSIGVLSGLRYHSQNKPAKKYPELIRHIPAVTGLVGASDKLGIKPPSDAIILSPGDAIQPALDAASRTGKWVVLTKGVHTLKKALSLPSNVTLAGQGKESVLILAAEVRGATIINAELNMSDISIRDLLIEGAVNPVANNDPNADRRLRSYMSAPSREGILFSGEKEGQIHNVQLENLTVQNFTKNGVSIRGAKKVIINNCDFSDNGASVVPGAGFHHNLHLNHSSAILVKNSRFDTSPWGNGIDISFCREVQLSDNEAARNNRSGIRFMESNMVNITGNLLEGNDGYGIFPDNLTGSSFHADLINNYLDYNGKNGIKIVGSKNLVTQKGNVFVGNGF